MLKSVIGVRGLFISANSLSAPDGGLVVCRNVSLARPDILAPTRGQTNPGLGQHEFGISTHRSPAAVMFGTDAVIHHGAGLTADTITRMPFSGLSPTAYAGTYSSPGDGLPIRFALANRSLYFTTYHGVYALDDIEGAPALAGVPKALEPEAVASGVTGNPDSGWMPEDSQVCYRIVWGLKDANGVVKLGAPSGRFVVVNPADFIVAAGSLTRAGGTTVTGTTTHKLPFGPTIVMAISPGETHFGAGNETLTVVSSTSFTYADAGSNISSASQQSFSSGSKNTVLRVLIPAGVTTSHFYRVYRSLTSDTAEVVADDECYLVYEDTPSAGELTAGYFDFTDRTPESLVGLGSPLYTNENTGDGILQAHERPPQAQDVCEWDGRLWLAQTIDRRRFTLQLLGVGSPDGLQADDTITIAGVTFTAKAAPATEAQFQLVSSLTPALNVEATAKALIAKINKHSTADVQAFYASGENEVPGKILIEKESIDFGQTAFAVYGSRPTSWHPALTTTSSGAQESSDDARPNGLAYSRTGILDAFPVSNRLDVGPRNVAVRRIVPLRDKLLVFPQYGGTYVVSKPWPYRVDILDATVTLLAPSSAVPHANQVFAYTSQGVVAISETGVRVLSEPIEQELRALRPASVSTDLMFGVSYESERTYSLWIPASLDGTAEADGHCGYAWVYSSLRETWEQHTGSARWGFVEPTEDLLWLGAGEANHITFENKTLSARDVRDGYILISITAVDGNVLTCADASGVTAGDMVYGDLVNDAIVLEVDYEANTLRMSSTEAFTVGTKLVYIAFESEAKWLPLVGSNPAQETQAQYVHLHFRELCAHRFDVTFDSDVGSSESVESITQPGFGLNAWGSAPWGDDLHPINRRIAVPAEHARSTQLRVGIRCREVGARWALHGLTLECEPSGTRSAD